MVATAFKVSMILFNPKRNLTKNITLTVSDVAAAFALFPSGGNELPLSSEDVLIKDMIFTGAGGTDTQQLQVYLNGIDTGVRVHGHLNLATGIGRQIQQAPIFVPAGAAVKLVQAA